MAQISVIKKSDITEAGRFDAEYFKPDTLKLITNIESLPFTRIGEEFDVTKLAGFEYTKYFTKQNMEIKNSYPALTSLNIQNENLVEEKSLKIDKNIADNFLSRSKLFFGDVVLSYTGEYRRSLVILKNGFQLGPNICLIRNKTNNINSFYLSTYLNSKIGQILLDREKTLSGQPTVAMSRIRTMAIPIFSDVFQQDIEDKILTAKEKQTKSKQLYKEAEQLLLEELNLLDYQPKHHTHFSTTKAEIEQAGRFDAEYFQPKYADIIKKIENYSGGFDIVKNVLNFNKINFFPENDKFYKYIPLSRVLNNGEIKIPKEELGKNLPTRARRKVKTGDVILSSISGSLETSAIIGKKHENFIVSNGFYVFNSGKINSETLLILFKSKIMLELLQKISKGAILGGYDLTAFEKLKIPLINQNIQQQIAQKITLSHQLRKQSKDLLELAKTKVEQEIENPVVN